VYEYTAHARESHTGIALQEWVRFGSVYEGWNFNSGNYLFTSDTK